MRYGVYTLIGILLTIWFCLCQYEKTLPKSETIDIVITNKFPHNNPEISVINFKILGDSVTHMLTDDIHKHFNLKNGDTVRGYEITSNIEREKLGISRSKHYKGDYDGIYALLGLMIVVIVLLYLTSERKDK